jgi:RNA polymerase sigma-70 factor (ECF subfamily)
VTQIPKHKIEFYEELIETTRQAMLDFASAHMNDDSQVEDVVQEACGTAWEKIDTLMASPNLGGWLMNTLKNHIRKLLEKMKVEQKLNEKLASDTSCEVVYQDALGENAVVEILSPEERLIAELREQGYTDSEIADFLGKKPSALRARLTRMRKKISKFLEDEKI